MARNVDLSAPFISHADIRDASPVSVLNGLFDLDPSTISWYWFPGQSIRATTKFRQIWTIELEQIGDQVWATIYCGNRNLGALDLNFYDCQALGIPMGVREAA